MLCEWLVEFLIICFGIIVDSSLELFLNKYLLRGLSLLCWFYKIVKEVEERVLNFKL